jgi:hypothetical protein
MIPPTQAIRLRSITRWIKDNSPELAKLPQKELEQIVLDKDQAMTDLYEEQRDELKTALMKQKVWGTEEGLQTFNLQTMELWQEIVSDALPVTSSPQSEDC